MTAFDPLASDAPLIVYLDIKSPYAFIAKDPTCALEDQLGVEIDWRPLTLDIPSYLGSARLGERDEVIEQDRTPEQWAAVKYAYRDARRYAALRGLTLRGTVKIWDTSIAHIGMMWAKRQGARAVRSFLDHVYPPFWRRELDTEDPAMITAVLQASGVDTSGFAAFLAGEGREEHDRMQERIFDAGIFGVPSYVVGGRVFFGREHLPTVRWLLGGRAGPAPDIAYRHFGPVTKETPAATGMLTVVIDFAQPESYLAVAPTRELARDLGLRIDWRPTTVPAPRAPDAPRAGDDRGTRHRRFRAQNRELDLAHYAGSQGLTLGNVYRTSDSRVAGLGLLWLQRHAPAAVPEYLDSVFAGHWRETLDETLEPSISNSNVAAIRRVLASVTSGGGDFDLESLRPEYDRLQDELRAAGVVGAPGYLHDGEFFLGRQHLPMIRWRLLGKSGPPPI